MTTQAVFLSGTITADSTPTDFTSSGFGTVQAAIVIVGNANATNNPQTGGQFSIGFWDGTNQVAMANCASITAVTGSRTSRLLKAGIIAATVGHNGTDPVITNEWTISNVTDGVRISISTDGTSVARYASVILIKGATAAHVGTQALGSDTNPVNVTGPGFQANAAFFACAGNGTLGTVETNGTGSVGVAEIGGTVVQRCMGWFSGHGANPSNVNQGILNDAVMMQAGSGSITWQAGVSSHASGFTVTPSANPSADVFGYLALELANAADIFVGDFDTATSTGSQGITGLGMAPQVFGTFGCRQASYGTVSNAPTGSLSFGVGTSGAAQALSAWDKDNVATTVSGARRSADLLNIRTTDDAAYHVASLTSVDSDGITINNTTAGASATKQILWALGDTSGDTTSPTLTSPTGTATGATTGTGTVSTDEGNGTLFAVVTTSATGPSVAQVKAGQDHTGAAAVYAVGSGSGQAVSATGTQNVSATGLTASTAYYWHYVHTDAATNNSNVASSASWTTSAAAVKGVRVRLFNGGAAMVGITGIRALWWDATEPNDTDLAYFSTTEATDSSGWLEIDIDAATALDVDDVGYLSVRKLDATDHHDSLVWQGRVTVVDIS